MACATFLKASLDVSCLHIPRLPADIPLINLITVLTRWGDLIYKSFCRQVAKFTRAVRAQSKITYPIVAETGSLITSIAPLHRASSPPSAERGRTVFNFVISFATNVFPTINIREVAAGITQHVLPHPFSGVNL